MRTALATRLEAPYEVVGVCLAAVSVASAGATSMPGRSGGVHGVRPALPGRPPAPGGVTIRETDPEGTRTSGAAFHLLDKDGKKTAGGTTDEQGVLVFKQLTAGTYRRHGTSSLDQDSGCTGTRRVEATVKLGEPLGSRKVLVRRRCTAAFPLVPGPAGRGVTDGADLRATRACARTSPRWCAS
ncbi:MSCRAMM family protein [Streptomyces laurentii]|uniref:MSCRAMM family protein n=1 Tax=Streptomyces laurentii TaxID=39478 RepID=UPI0036D1F5C9